MSESEPKPITEIEVDTNNLYREESYTDLKVASIRRLVPIQLDGSEDPSRPCRFLGETTLMSARGPLPVSCPIDDATTLEEAIAAFPDAVNAAVERMIEEAREMQRQEMSRIVVPGGPGGAPGGLPPVPGGGKIIT